MFHTTDPNSDSLYVYEWLRERAHALWPRRGKQIGTLQPTALANETILNVCFRPATAKKLMELGLDLRTLDASAVRPEDVPTMRSIFAREMTTALFDYKRKKFGTAKRQKGFEKLEISEAVEMCVSGGARSTLESVENTDAAEAILETIGRIQDEGMPRELSRVPNEFPEFFLAWLLNDWTAREASEKWIALGHSTDIELDSARKGLEAHRKTLQTWLASRLERN